MFKKITYVFLAVFLLSIAGCDEEKDDGEPYDIDGIEEAAKLKNIFAGKFLIGNIVNPEYLTGNHNKLLLAHFNAATCENDMKPERLAPNSSGYSWGPADAQVNAMFNAGMTVHGHTLVWHEQTPSWMTANNAEINMKKYIEDVMGHFKDKITAWDVVNEAMKNDGLSKYENEIMNQGKWKEYLRNTVDSDGNAASLWMQKIGADYIYIAFKTARAADPDAILYYNDYGLNGTYKPRAVYNMIKEINEDWANDTDNLDKSRKLIEGIGMQGHYSSTWLNAASLTAIERNMRYYLELGIRVDISELDIEDREVVKADQGKTGRNTTMTPAAANKQAEDYESIFKLFLKLDEEFPDQITRITMWGLDDATSWKSLGNPCLFDASLRPKPAFWSVSNLLN